MKEQPIVTFGADPEFFVYDSILKRIVPACGKFGGNKGAPVWMTPRAGFLEDGVTIEINVAPEKDTTTLLGSLLEAVSLWEHRHPNYVLVSKAEHEFTKRDLRNKKANTVGCAEDLWVYGPRERPSVADWGKWRFAGGHIHVGIEPWPEGKTKLDLVQQLDDFAYSPLVGKVSAIRNGARYPHYGVPGLYRETPYGIEYRSPPPMWVFGEYPDDDHHYDNFLTALEGVVKEFAGVV